MNENVKHKNQTILHNEYHDPENIIGQYVMELPVFGDKTRKTQNDQRKKKVLKPIRTHTLSATRKQQGSSNNTPYQTIYTNRTGAAHSNTSNINNVLFNDHVLRIKQLENELVEARMKTEELITENRLLKTLGKRHENALSVYEGEQAKLPRLIKSYEEDIRTLQNRIRQLKISFREMENRYKSQSNELLVLQKQHKHLLSLTKNKDLSKKEELHRQLEEAHNTIRRQHCEIQNYVKQLELQNKTHRYHMNSENIKIKELRLELKRLKDENQNVGSKTKHVSARQSFAKGITENSIKITPCVVKRVPTIHGQGDNIEEPLYKTNGSISLKPESSYGDNFSIIKIAQNHTTKDFNIPVNDKPLSSSSSSSNIPWKSHGTVKLTNENKTDLSNIINSEFGKQTEQKVSMSAKTPMSRIQKDMLLAHLNQVDEEKISHENYYKSKTFKQSVKNSYPSSDSSDANSESGESD